MDVDPWEGTGNKERIRPADAQIVKPKVAESWKCSTCNPKVSTICQWCCWFKCPFVLYKEKVKGDWRQLIINLLFQSLSAYPSHNILKFFLISSEHRFYKSSLSVHVILVWCVIFNLSCCSDVRVMKLGHVWVLCGKQSWDHFYNHHPENQTHNVLLDLLPSHELLSTSFEPCRTSPALSLLTKWERKITAEPMWAQPGAAAAAEGALVSPNCAHPPAAEHHTLLNCPFNGTLEHRIQMIRNKKWVFNFFFSSFKSNCFKILCWQSDTG